MNRFLFLNDYIIVKIYELIINFLCLWHFYSMWAFILMRKTMELTSFFKFRKFFLYSVSFLLWQNVIHMLNIFEHLLMSLIEWMFSSFKLLHYLRLYWLLGELLEEIFKIVCWIRLFLYLLTFVKNIPDIIFISCKIKRIHLLAFVWIVSFCRYTQSFLHFGS